MYCSPLLRSPRTLIPAGLREALGLLLGGPPAAKNPANREVCLFALGMIGDAVLALSALRRLIEHHGQQNCVLVVTPAVHALIGREFPGVETVVLPGDASSLTRDILPLWRRERKKFAAYRFARRVCLSHQRSLYYELALSWSDARADFRLLPETYPAEPADTCTELQAHRHITERALGRPVDLAEILPRFNTATASDDGRLLVYPLSLNADKDLPVERVVALLRLWRKRSQAPVVLGGRPDADPALQQYAVSLRAAGMADVTVETPAGVCAFVDHVARAGALLSAESAAAHIGTALDKTSVVVVPPPLWGYGQPWQKSARQHAFRFDAPDAEIAKALPAL